VKRVRLGRRYSYYSKIRHNSRTYKVEIKDVNNNNAFKKYYTVAKIQNIYCNFALRCCAYTSLILSRLLGWVGYSVRKHVILIYILRSLTSP
jgi:hypothetical protein